MTGLSAFERADRAFCRAWRRKYGKNAIIPFRVSVGVEEAADDFRRMNGVAVGSICPCCDKPLPPPYEGSRMCAECAE